MSLFYKLNFIILLFCIGLGANDSLAQYRFRFLTNDITVLDARPVFAPDGKSIVFMRQPHNGNANALAALYTVSLTTGKTKLLFNGINPKTGQRFNATRPDYSWCRCSYQIAFDAVNDGIWLLDVKTKNVRQVLEPTIEGENYTWSYPSWYPDGKSLSVTNYNNSPRALYHTLVKANADKYNSFTLLTDNQLVWPGESSVSQTNPKQLTFAGQAPVDAPPPACNCIGGCTVDGYAQNCNQIWLQKNGIPAPIDGLQGRAPWFSPDGKHLVFESNRANPDHPATYRLFIYSLKDLSIKVVTPDALNVQHAKWSPDGKMLCFAVQLLGGAQGIALLEFK